MFGCYSGEDPPREDLEGTSKRETRVKKNCPRHIKYCLKTHNSEVFIEKNFLKSGLFVNKFRCTGYVRYFYFQQFIAWVLCMFFSRHELGFPIQIQLNNIFIYVWNARSLNFILVFCMCIGDTNKLTFSCGTNPLKPPNGCATLFSRTTCACE